MFTNSFSFHKIYSKYYSYFIKNKFKLKFKTKRIIYRKLHIETLLIGQGIFTKKKNQEPVDLTMCYVR